MTKGHNSRRAPIVSSTHRGVPSNRAPAFLKAVSSAAAAARRDRYRIEEATTEQSRLDDRVQKLREQLGSASRARESSPPPVTAEDRILRASAETAASWDTTAGAAILSIGSDGILVAGWVTVIAVLSLAGAISSPSVTTSVPGDAEISSLKPLADTLAVVIVAIVYSALAFSLLAAAVDSTRRVRAWMEDAWGLLHWSASRYGDLAGAPVRSRVADNEEQTAEGELPPEPSAPDEDPIIRAAFAPHPAPARGRDRLSLDVALRAGDGWNIGAELVGRLWYEIWDLLFLENWVAAMNTSEDLPADGTAEREAVDVAARWALLKDAATTFHMPRCVRSVHPDDASARLRRWVEDNLEGPDVFWDGPTDDGREPSRTRFGTLSVDAFPWRAYLAFDDCDEGVVLWDEQLPALVSRNTDPAIAGRRALRRQLRALNGQTVPLSLDRKEPHSVHDGTEIYEDGYKTKRSRPRLANVEVTMRYRRGTIRVRVRDESDVFSRGFGVAMEFADGRGVAEAPKTRKLHEFRDMYVEVPASEIGMNDEFDMAEKLRELLWSEEAQAIIAIRLPAVESALTRERTRRRLARNAEQALLPAGFLTDVFVQVAFESDDDVLTAAREAARAGRGVAASLTDETDPSLMASRFLTALERLRPLIRTTLDRSAAVASGGPLGAAWFLVFHDVWRNNSHRLAAQQQQFDDHLPSSICYRPMPRIQLEQWLDAHGMLSSSRFFRPEDLDALYAALLEIHAAALIRQHASAARRAKRRLA